MSKYCIVLCTFFFPLNLSMLCEADFFLEEEQAAKLICYTNLRTTVTSLELICYMCMPTHTQSCIHLL